ncbi:hypothetical protein [Bremerella cremea]|uniref:hypothetical protein n=1 Tax=Bremerella cremea TaxID=1031537 RepID=UPI0031ECA313
MTNHYQRERLSDFQSRTAFSLGNLLSHPRGHGRYLPTHPFADDADLLAELDLTPADCRNVDAWWELHEDACLIQAYTFGHVTPAGPGLYAYRQKAPPHFVTLIVVLECESIDRAMLEQAMACIAKLGFPRDLIFDLSPGSAPIRIEAF